MMMMTDQVPRQRAGRVLVVEDEELLREMLVGYLGQEGYHVDSCGDGQSALARLATESYDVVLSDIRLPRLSGLDFLDEARRRWPQLKVVLMTGQGPLSQAQLVQAIRNQANGYLEKPFPLEAAKQAIVSALSGGVGAQHRWLTDRYELLSEIARGAMGVVYKGRQLGLDRLVAIKVQPRPAHRPPAQTFDPTSSQRIRAEAIALARLHHPNIAIVYDYGHEGDEDFFAMEYVEGATLSQYLLRRRRSVDEVLEVMLPIADALGHAHDLAICHHDVKPNNIMISWEGRPVLVDFGVASKFTDPFAVPEYLEGTLFYLAPEYAESTPYTEFCDMYSYGVLLYEALAGKGCHPFGIDVKQVERPLELVAMITSATCPKVTQALVPISSATTWAKVVLPRPGGPNSST